MTAAASQAVDHLVDVGIPTFGEPTFLAEAIESVLGQTLTEWRLTISENGPESPAVAAAVEPFLSDPRVRFVSTGSNLGAARNWSRLIQTGQAPYVAILNDDDMWGPGFLARRVAFLAEHPGCGFVFSPTDNIDETGAVIYRHDFDLREGVQPRGPFLRAIYLDQFASSQNTVVRRAAYEAVGAEFDPNILFFDYEMLFRLAVRFDVGLLSEADAQWRVYASQITQRERRNIGHHRLEFLDAVETYLPPDVPRLMRRRARYIAYIRSGLGAYASGERRRSAGAFLNALRVHPLGPLDPRVAQRMVRRIRAGSD
jgi:glycosyltransferase involved in cell wall biosynthesis